MSLEFVCPGCERELSVPDSAAGKSAKCPSCATIVTVPSELPSFAADLTSNEPFALADPSPTSALPASGNPFADLGDAHRPMQPAGDLLNPYASPGAVDLPIAGDGNETIGNREVSVAAVLNQSFELWQKHLLLLFAITVVIVVAQLGIQFIGSRVLWSFGPVLGWELMRVCQWGLGLLTILVRTFLTIGQMQMCLKMCRRQPVAFSDLFGGAPRFIPAIAALLIVLVPYYVYMFASSSLLMGLARQLGPDLFGLHSLLTLLVVAVFIVLFWPYYYLVVDGKASVLESFAMAWRITRGNRLTTFLLLLVGSVFLVVGLLACFVGVLFAVPLIFIMQTVAYLMMSGQMPAAGFARRSRY